MDDHTADMFDAGKTATDTARDLTERVTGASREFGTFALDAYEQAVQGWLALEQRTAEATPFDWAKSAIGAHAAFVRDVNAAYVSAVRQLMH